MDEPRTLVRHGETGKAQLSTLIDKQADSRVRRSLLDIAIHSMTSLLTTHARAR
jgi:hypothetical protein